MNQAKYNPSPPRKSRSPKPIIRSAAFRKKFEDGMPRINHKAIQFHNFYDIEISNMQIAKEHGLNFWGCVMPEKKRFKVRQIHSQQKRESQTRGETIFKKYMKRRPSLHLTPRSFDFEKQDLSKNYQTITDFRTEAVNKQQDKVQKYTNSQNLIREQKTAKTTNNFLMTQDDISTINKKSLYQMTPHELEISIEWKKKFLQIFQKKMKEAQNFEYNFKPYRI